MQSKRREINVTNGHSTVPISALIDSPYSLSFSSLQLHVSLFNFHRSVQLLKGERSLLLCSSRIWVQFYLFFSFAEASSHFISFAHIALFFAHLGPVWFFFFSFAEAGSHFISFAHVPLFFTHLGPVWNFFFLCCCWFSFYKFCSYYSVLHASGSSFIYFFPLPKLVLIL